MGDGEAKASAYEELARIDADLRGDPASALLGWQQAVDSEPTRMSSLRALEKAYARSHIRVVVIDGRIGYTGGFGMDDKWLGSGRSEDEWRDTNVRFTGPAVNQLQDGEA